MLTILHSNVARIDSGVLTVDRKFHLGMQRYVEAIASPILTVHPEHDGETEIMDPVTVSFNEIGYRVMTLKTNRLGGPAATETNRLRDQISKSELAYFCGGFLDPKLARSLGVPYVLAIECDLRTQIVISKSEVSSVFRRAARTARCSVRYAKTGIPAMRGAHSLHCNGYPVFDESRWFNANRLLYLDSRMTANLVVTEAQLNSRFASQGRRSARLLFSGRYEPLKGAVDVVRVAVECIRRGVDVELHCYGQGSLKAEMTRIAATAGLLGTQIRIHDAIPFDELTKVAHTFDLFVCCHVQGDPSCTYLETLGAGLPIVGYGNSMWKRLCQESKSGFWSPVGDVIAVAADIQKLTSDWTQLRTMSENARRFALAHTFDCEFSRRTDSINEALNSLRSSRLATQ